MIGRLDFAESDPEPEAFVEKADEEFDPCIGNADSGGKLPFAGKCQTIPAVIKEAMNRQLRALMMLRRRVP